jgi:hypothetical protein
MSNDFFHQPFTPLRSQGPISSHDRYNYNHDSQNDNGGNSLVNSKNPPPPPPPPIRPTKVSVGQLPPSIHRSQATISKQKETPITTTSREKDNQNNTFTTANNINSDNSRIYNGKNNGNRTYGDFKATTQSGPTSSFHQSIATTGSNVTSSTSSVQSWNGQNSAMGKRPTGNYYGVTAAAATSTSNNHTDNGINTPF